MAGPSDQKRCGFCRHWSLWTQNIGSCKRYPPVIVRGTGTEIVSPSQAVPDTSHVDWCGEHEPIEVLTNA